MSAVARGAYGFRFDGVADSRLAVDVSTDAPTIHVEILEGDVATPEPEIEETHAVLPLLGGGRVTILPDPIRATFEFAVAPEPESFLHPFGGGSAAIASRWLGREGFHAGAFAAGGRAWGVLGEKGAGKSTILGWLVQHGVPVLADDLLIVEDGVVRAGPRCVDLRPDAAARLGIGTNIGVIGARERWRVDPGAATDLPLGGFVSPVWSDRVSVEPVPAAARPGLLLRNIAVIRPHRHPERILDLAALPFYELARPRDFATIDVAMAALLDRLCG